MCEHATGGHEHHEHPAVDLVLLYQVVLLCLAHMTCFSVYSITTVSAPRTPCRPLLVLSGCPMYVCRSLCLPGEVGHPLSGCFFFSSCCLRSTSSRHLCMVSCVWIVPLFYTILSCCRSKIYCCMDIAVMHDGARTWSPLASQILYMPRI